MLNFSKVVGSLCAIAVPILFLLIGEVAHVLVESGAGTKHSFAIGLPTFDQWLPATMTPLTKVSVLLSGALLVSFFTAFTLNILNRQVQAAAVEFEVGIFRELRSHSKQLGVVRTLSAQQTALVDGLEYHLPRVRTSLTQWWRTYPRHLVQLIGCLLLALLIQPLLTLLTVVGSALVTLIYRFVDRNRRSLLPVIRERAAQRRVDLMSMCLKGPLLESVHAEQEIDQHFAEQIANYRSEAVKSLSSSAWKVPLIIAIVAILGCLFQFIVAVQVLRPESTISISGSVTFLLAGIGAAISAVRLQRSARELRQVESAADELKNFLSLPVEKFNGTGLKSITRVTNHAELDHVTLQDSSGRKLLENVSASFKPDSLIGIVSSERLQAQALVELLMGYGRPVSGRLLIDGTLVSDLTPESLSNCSLWVSADGPLITGTVQDNLSRRTGDYASLDINEILRASKAMDIVQRLPDGMATLVTPGDDRLTEDAAFRLGIARANLRSPSIVVIEEPDKHVDAKTEQDTVEAIRSLVKPTSITLVMPHRLLTLRQCDSVLLLHDHKVVDIGTHAELLQRCELYRHLNYVRFNPFRGLGA
jgi:ABC-type multidrug transport system fused ATPase/permease subunit